MKSTITYSTKLIAFFILYFLSFSTTVAQTFSTGCSSKDLQLVGASLSGGDLCNSCASETELTRTLVMSINNTTGSTRTSFAYWGTLEEYSGIDGQLVKTTSINDCGGPLLGNTITSLPSLPITYTCGNILKITGLHLAWTDASPNSICPLNPSNISPKCGTLPAIQINAGVNGELILTNAQCGTSNGMIDLTPTGGTAPYTYKWTSSDGIVPAGQVNNQDLINIVAGTYTVEITDANNCKITKTRTVDSTPPTIASFAQVSDITVPCGAATTSSLLYTNNESGNCLISGSVISSISSQSPSGACGGDITESWTFTDTFGRTINKSRIIHVSPAALPTMTAPANITVACGALPQPTTIPFSNGLSGGCLISGTSNASTFSATPNACGGNVTETWTATDICGRTVASVSRTITVSPAALPTMKAPENITVACGALPVPTTIPFSNGLSGGCLVSGTSNASTFSATPNACGGNVTETWTATDTCGRKLASVSRTITVSPAALPTMTAPENITVACGALPAPTTIAFSNGLSGGCLISGTSNASTFSTTPNACGGKVTETWTATDTCGRTVASVSRTITVSPAALPTMTAPENITVACGALPAPTTVAFSNGLSGGCLISGTSNASTFSTTPNACGGNVTETWTATDTCGRTIASVSRTINVSPAALPTMKAPENITVACGALPAPSTIAFSNGLSGGCLISGTSNASTFSATPNSCGGNVTETWTATDTCGRTVASVSRTITVSPAALPTMKAPENITVACGALPTPSTIAFSNGLSGGCLISGTSNPSTFSATPKACGGNVTETWTATDTCGRTVASVSRTITVSPAALPTMTAPENITVACGALPAPTTIAFSNGLSEGCLISGTSNTSTFSTTVSGYCNGKVIETWTATDSCGRTIASVSRTITIDDKTPPTFTAPSNIIITTNESCSYNSSVAITGDVTDENDNCSTGIQATYNDQIIEGPCDGSYIINRTWSLMDLCGNKAEDRIQIITVKDTTPPQIATQASNILVSCDGQGNQTQLSDWLNSNGGAIATDNCSKTLNWTNDFNALSNDCSTSVTVTFTVKDNCGNASTTTATFSINDTIKPVLGEVPADMTVECDAVPTASAEDVTATDNCETNQIVTFKEVRTDGNCASNYILTRTWTATDACSNSSSKSQTITVQDTSSPLLGEIPADITVECDVVPTASAEDVSATDNCDNNPIISYEEARTDGNCTSNYTLTRTWTATDACGNSSSKSQTITVQDTTAPLLGELPSDITVECNAVPTASEEDVSATDNCDNNPKVSYEEVRTDGNCASNYTLTRTWTATDVCGNSSSKSQTIIVQDTTAPLLGEIPADVTVECDAIPTASAEDVSATDNCDNNPIVSYEEVRTDGNCISNYTLTRTWTATDICGNSSSKSQTITVEDTTAAVIISCANEQTIASDSSCKALVPDFTSTLIASDNCTPSESLMVSQSPLAGSEVMAGITTIILTVKDACGNESTCETKLIVTNYIVANDDDASATPVNGFSGGIAIPNVLTNDMLNCQEINPTEVTITALNDPADGVTLNPITGEVIVAAGTPTGTYTINYQICENTNPTNCDDALITVTVSAAVIDAVDDIGGYVTTAIGGQALQNVLNNDTLNGNPATLSNVNLIQVSTTNPGVTLNTNTGAINVAAGTPAGNYLLTYQICDKLNSSNCDTAIVRVFVASPQLQVIKTANNENYSSVGDILNYTIQVINTGNVTLSQITVTDELTNFSTVIQSLEPGSSQEFTQNYTVTQEDRVRGFVTNIARANGFTPNELPISDDDSATVEAAIVLGCATITVHNAFSPNGDGINEVFVIENLDDVLCYPNNSVEIYNRWGVLVFETRDYNNQSNYFDGISKGRTTVSQSSGLPTGTYYYILNYTSIDGTGGLNNNRKDGFLYLTR